jgi:hypothetical protein
VTPLRNFLRPENGAAGDAGTPGGPDHHPAQSRLKKVSSGFRSVLWLDLFIIFAAGALSVFQRYEGWRSRELLNLDMIPYYIGAKEFLSTGTAMEKGELASYDSYNPPGTFYLIIPGMLTISDPRLQNLAGTLLMLYGTLAFLYLAAREVAGRTVALSTAVIYALTRLGFMGLWPIGHPLFIVASLYFLLLWIKRRASWALAATLAILAFGLYMDLAILPFLFVIPVLWLLYRPPLACRSVLLAAAFGLLLWFPYLRYEYSRGFVDLASLLLLRPVDTVWEDTQTTPVYCYATRPGENDVPNGVYLPYIGGPEIEARVVYPLPGWKDQLAYRSCRMMMNIDRNFDADLFLLGDNRYLGASLWWVFMIGWMTLAWIGARIWAPVRRLVHAIAEKKNWIPLVLGLGGAFLFYWMASPSVLENFTADRSINRNILLAVVQFREYMPWIWLSVCLGLFFSVYVPDHNPENTVLLIAFSLPWAVLLVLGEPGRPERFWNMWSLQILVLVLFLRWVADRFPRPRTTYWILVAALGIALFPIPFFSENIKNILTQGYGGSDNDQWKVVEYLAEQAVPGSDRTLRVEYWLADSLYPRDPAHPGNQIQDWFDYLLLSRFGVQNVGPECPGPTACDRWVVVDRDAGVPESLREESPEIVLGHYLIFRLP